MSYSFLRLTSLFMLILLNLGTVSRGQDEPDALQAIESERTGRHWIDSPIEPAKSPEEALKSFQIEPGMRIELVAAEPLVFDPVALTFDEHGHMFVAEYRDYPIGPEVEGDPPLSRVVKLLDTNGDGRMDERHVFADHVFFANSLMAWKGGLLVASQTSIVFFKDTDGDHQADVRQVVFEGFVPGHAQMQISCPRWGLDNWITLNYGVGKIHRLPNASESISEKTVELPRADFRFHPLTMEFGSDSGASQYGNTIDRWGHRFFCTNRNPIMVSMLSAEEVARNPYLIIPKAFVDVAPSGGDTRVYPLIDMKSNYLSHAGTHTSACGVTAYIGDRLGGGFEDSVFVCEPVGHLVTRSLVHQEGVGLKATRAQPKADFLASNDQWFRPASLANGPDGALYLADMYRLYVEHPRFFPEDIAARLNWRAGEDRGRIWRIIPEQEAVNTASRFAAPQTTEDLVALLGDANGWRRFLGQRLLVERQVQGAVPQLRKLLLRRSASASSTSTATAGQVELPALTRLHAMWTLDGLGALQASDLQAALNDPLPNVRRDAVKLAGQHLKDHAQYVDLLAERANDDSVLVRYQVALALGISDDPRAVGLLTQLALRDGADEWFSTAIETAAAERSVAIVLQLVNAAQAKQVAVPIDLVRQLSAIAGTRGDERELQQLLQSVGETAAAVAASGKKSELGWQIAALSGLADGLPRHSGALGKTSLQKLLASPSKTLKASVAGIRGLMDQLHGLALDASRSEKEREVAVALLAREPLDRSAETLTELLSLGQPTSVQLAAVAALNSGDPRAAEILLDRWPTLSPAARGPVLETLFRRTPSTLLVLEAMAEGTMNSAGVSIDRRALLLK
ncbi:MAG: HEAT repeat domain-containing protein, partial [Planctomycetales bacterium]|nr:HEAT repeat domain-containing protein [Planctomycetales bacterium]